jgi:hypothetical protein
MTSTSYQRAFLDRHNRSEAGANDGAKQVHAPTERLLQRRGAKPSSGTGRLLDHYLGAIQRQIGETFVAAIEDQGEPTTST